MATSTVVSIRARGVRRSSVTKNLLRDADASIGAVARIANRREGSSDGRALALVPVVVAIVMLCLSMKHAAPPADVPLPVVDARALAVTESADDALADRAAHEGLPQEERALGSAI